MRQYGTCKVIEIHFVPSFSTQEECDAICVRGAELKVPDSSATERPGELIVRYGKIKPGCIVLILELYQNDTSSCFA